jgi:5-methylcytosine-specific restriction endonuclease McrA
MASQKALQKEHAWNNASTIRGKDPDLYRRDTQGNEIYRHSYGKYSPMGWQLDHKNPIANGGSEHLRNIQALQSHENARKSDKYPYR